MRERGRRFRFEVAMAGGVLGAIGGGIVLAGLLSLVCALIALAIRFGVSPCATGGGIVGGLFGALGGLVAGAYRGATEHRVSLRAAVGAAVAVMVGVLLLCWGPLWDRAIIAAFALVALTGGLTVGDLIAWHPERPPGAVELPPGK